MATQDKSKGAVFAVLLVLLIGGGLLYLSLKTTKPAPKLEELKVVEGQIQVISTREKILSGAVTSVEFVCGPITLQYSVQGANYPKIRDALLRGGKMKIWYIAGDTISGARTGNLTIYRIVEGSDELLTYDEGVADKQFKERLMLWAGIGFLALGSFGGIRVLMAFMAGDPPLRGHANRAGNGKLDMSKIKLK